MTPTEDQAGVTGDEQQTNPPLAAIDGDPVASGQVTMSGVFDPYRIAEICAERGEDPLPSVLGQFGGYLSACWEHLAGAGVFLSTDAAAALKATLAWLEDGGGLGEVADLRRVSAEELLVISLPADTPPELGQAIAEQLDTVLSDSDERFLVFRGAQLRVVDRHDVTLEPVYVEYTSEWFRGVVGPFVDRAEADAWAQAFTAGGVAEWSGASVFTPGQAAIARTRSYDAAHASDD